MKDDLLIIDTLSHGPLVWNDTLVGMSNEMIESGLSPFRIVQELTLELAKMLVEDPDYFQQYTHAWEESGVTCVSWTLGAIHEQPYSLEGAYHNYAYMTHILDNRRDFFVKALRAFDIERAHNGGKRAIIFNFQNLEHIGTNLDLLDRFYQMGFRIMQLTYNSRNPIGCGCTEEVDTGLTEFGVSVVERLNQLGVLVDVSHCGPKTSMDAALHSKVPIACTHTFAKGLYDHDRGKDDELLETVAERGGYIGILAVPGFLTEKSTATIDDMLDHLHYVANLVGLEHVGLGTDFFGYSLPENLAAKIDELVGMLGFRPEHRAGFTQKIEGFEDYTGFPHIIAALERRGYSEGEIEKLAGRNFLEVFREVVG
ncbi:MAG: membrane dipeptidase [Candidatus Hydrogenedentota bacterium]|nr:MAG: membrane dipeptidase [Candidatus Hydrogenedentota bacterium]